MDGVRNGIDEIVLNNWSKGQREGNFVWRPWERRAADFVGSVGGI